MFSIIIPLYNKAPYIQRAIDAVLEQTFQEFEIIVVNDGSTDGGEELVKEIYASKVRLINQTNQGVSMARNRGIKESNFPWIAFLDADDYWHSNYLKTIKKMIGLYPEVGIVGTGYTSGLLSLSDSPNYVLLSDYFAKAIHNTFYFTSATTIKKLFFEHNPGFDCDLKLGEDLDVWFRANLYFGDGAYTSEKLVFYGNEDENRAIKMLYNYSDTLISKISQGNYFNIAQKKSETSQYEFELFRDKWLYFNIFPLYRVKSNKGNLKKLISNLPCRLYLIRLFYLLPFGVLYQLFSKDAIAHFFRNYMKFCFRYIYV